MKAEGAYLIDRIWLQGKHIEIYAIITTQAESIVF